SVCYHRADVPAANASCDGAGACQTAAALCPSQGMGSSASSCDPVCQTPTAGTCTGTTGGSCTNIAGSPPNTPCGHGTCARTIAHCSSGAQQTCVPGTPGTETCNSLDDNCNGVVDDGLSGDVYESNNSCGGVHNIGTVTTSNTTITISATLYGS